MLTSCSSTAPSLCDRSRPPRPRPGGRGGVGRQDDETAGRDFPGSSRTRPVGSDSRSTGHSTMSIPRESRSSQAFEKWRLGDAGLFLGMDEDCDGGWSEQCQEPGPPHHLDASASVRGTGGYHDLCAERAPSMGIAESLSPEAGTRIAEAACRKAAATWRTLAG